MTTNDNLQPSYCEVCNDPFSDEEYEDRHSFHDLADCDRRHGEETCDCSMTYDAHEGCCPDCNADDPEPEPEPPSGEGGGGGLFRLGRIVATPGALDRMDQWGMDSMELLGRHVRGDWGNVPVEDAEENELSVRVGFRILSSYGEGDARIWIITEADRSVTTLLRPEDY